MTDYEAWVKRGLDAFNRRDWEAVARGLPEHFEVHDHVSVDDVVRRGPHALREVTAVNADNAFDGLLMEPLEVLAHEPEPGVAIVAVRVKATASGLASGAPVVAEMAQVWTLRDRVPQRFEQFRQWPDALAAAGIEA